MDNEYLLLSANVEYTPHDGDVTGSGCSASYRQNHKKLFLKDGENLYKMYVHFVFSIKKNQSSDIVLQR